MSNEDVIARKAINALNSESRMLKTRIVKIEKQLSKLQDQIESDERKQDGFEKKEDNT